MSIHHHIDDVTLMSYVAGTLSEPLAAVVACHLDMCAHCRAEVQDMEALGGLMLETVDAAGGSHMNTPSRDRLEAFLDIPEPTSKTGVAGALQKLLPTGWDNVAWKRLGPGIRYVELPLTNRAAGYLRLMKFAPGIKLPEHTHRGGELTLVLEGGYQDERGHYLPGDIADHDEEVLHRPIIDLDGECVSLVAAERPAIYTDLLPRLLQPMTGM